MISIRQVKAEEVSYVEEMQKDWALSFEGYEIWPRDWLFKHLGPYFLVAEDEYGAIVGYAIATPRAEKGDQPEHLAIQDLYVLRSHRTHGAGTKLLLAILAQAREDRWKIIRLTPVCEVSDLERLEAFYERHGFRWEEPPNFMRLSCSYS